MIQLSIIIVNYNVKEFVSNLITSIRKAVKNISHEIIIVDNASTDGSAEFIRTKFPDIQLIANQKNIGFGAANNSGMEKARGEFFVLLNPDTIVREDTFEKLFRFFEENPQAGMAGCKVLNPDGSLQLGCRRSFPGIWNSFTKVTGLSRLFPGSSLFARYNLTYLDENQTYEVDALSGSFMMLRRKVYEEIGGFDSQFFMYGEDLDLCYRIQKKGWKLYYVHTTEIIHYKGESTKRSNIDETKLFYDAMHLFVNKHFSSSLIIKFILRSGIIIRKFFTFLYINRLSILASIFDLALFITAIYAAERLYSKENWHGFPDFVVPEIYILPALIQLSISALTGAYERNRLSVLKILLSILIGFVIISSITYFFKQFAFSRAVVIITYVLFLIGIILWRVVVKLIFKWGISYDTKKSRTLIVGTGFRAVKIADSIKTNFVSIHDVIGLCGNSINEIGKKINNYQIIGSLQNFKKTIIENKIDKVIFASDDFTNNQLFSAVSSCQNENVEFLIAGNDMDYVVGKSSITLLDDIPLLKIQYNISKTVIKVTKSIFDFILSLPILILLFPWVVLISLVKKRKSNFVKFIVNVPLVFIGRMSFVGPRNLNSDSELYLGKCGLTGLWFTEEVDENDIKEINKLDIYYAKNANIWMDMEILGKTLAKMFIKSRE